MGSADKARNAAEEMSGKAKEKVGRATGNESLEAKGQGQRTKAQAKQAGEKVKDVFKD